MSQLTPIVLPIEQMDRMLPAHLQDVYWRPCLLFFLAVPVLALHIENYFSFEREEIDSQRFNREVYPVLSSGQQFLVNLAFHIFNFNNPLPEDGLAGLRLLDSCNYNLAMATIRLSTYG